jgi:ATP-dependent DNA helicase RecG
MGVTAVIFHTGILPGAIQAHTEPSASNLVTGEVTGEVGKLLHVMAGESSRHQLQMALGLKHEGYFREAYLKPALALGLIERTRPDKPNSRLQKYRLTNTGAAWLAAKAGAGQ